MKVLIFGASGMVGQGALHACLADPGVEAVTVVGRSACGVTHAKLREVLAADLYDYAPLEKDLAGHDACFFCLGVSAAGMTEEQYHHVTYDLTLAAARALVKLSPGMTFVYVSGASTDGSEKGGTMWARVKGKTENALLALGFARAFMFRPAYIQPMRGIRSKTTSYRVLYAILGPLYPVWKTLAPRYVTNTDEVGRAMLRVAREGFSKPVLENADIRALGA